MALASGYGSEWEGSTTDLPRFGFSPNSWGSSGRSATGCNLSAAGPPALLFGGWSWRDGSWETRRGAREGKEKQVEEEEEEGLLRILMVHEIGRERETDG